VALIAYLKKKQSEGAAPRTGAEDITVGEFARDMCPNWASRSTCTSWGKDTVTAPGIRRIGQHPEGI
jgi:hypothetical protein